METDYGKEARFGRPWRRFAAVAAGVLMVTGLTAALPAQADPTIASLTGEELIQESRDNVTGSSYSCSGGASTLTFTATGDATGPYPGTFTETGTVKMDMQSPNQGTLLAFTANFTIISANGTVTGTKTMSARQGPNSSASCDEVGALFVLGDLDYTAQITTPSGTSTDQGASVMTHVRLCPDICGTTSIYKAFFETFVSGPITPASPATLVLSPAAVTNPVGTEHCVTATATDVSGNPVSGVAVRFTVTGPVTTSGFGTTNVAGQATFCYNGPELPGTDAITAYADLDNDSAQDLGEPAGAATKTWALPISTPLCQVTITNGGRITANDGDKATFGGTAQVSKKGQPKGSQNYQDHGPAKRLTVKSTTILAVVCGPDQKQASIYGKATINGTGSYLFKIDVRDIAEPGVGKDTYRILLSNGYDSGAHPLEGGNIQIRIG